MEILTRSKYSVVLFQSDIMHARQAINSFSFVTTKSFFIVQQIWQHSQWAARLLLPLNPLDREHSHRLENPLQPNPFILLLQQLVIHPKQKVLWRLKTQLMSQSSR